MIEAAEEMVVMDCGVYPTAEDGSKHLMMTARVGGEKGRLEEHTRWPDVDVGW